MDNSDEEGQGPEQEWSGKHVTMKSSRQAKPTPKHEAKCAQEGKDRKVKLV